MNTLITSGIRISVESAYRPDESKAEEGAFFFSYQVTIQNNSDITVQLKRRHWHIFDSCGECYEVKGEGVVGELPILAPGESFKYVSGCRLRSDIGKMFGTYHMERLFDGQVFFVKIPVFNLVAPFRLN